MTLKAADPPTARFGRIDFVVLGAVLLLGLMHLPFPFDTEQAVHLQGAKQMDQGALLYRDFWDIHPPAIYAFNWFAGKLFGFGEIGVHAFELLVLLSFALWLRAWLFRYRCEAWTASLAPLLIVGYYYAVTGTWHLTQPEGLVGVPLFLSLGWLIRARQSEAGRGRWLFLAGLMAGLATLFKPLFIAFAFAFWTQTALAMARNGRRPSVWHLVGTGVPFALGLALPVVAVVAFYAGHGMLDTLKWTFVTMPARLLAGIHGLRFAPLVDGLLWFTGRYGPLAALAAFGAGVRFRRSEADPLRSGLILWLAVAAAVILVQRTSWWPYHYLLFSVPLGILGARGVTVLAAALDAQIPSRFGRAAGRVAIWLLFSGPLVIALTKAAFLFRYRLTLTEEEHTQFQGKMSADYAATMDDIAFLKGRHARVGDIFVVGGEPYYWLSGRGQAGHPKGVWFFRVLNASEWSRLAADLEHHPPAYVFVQSDLHDLAVTRTGVNADFADFLSRAYRPSRASPTGTWYERSGAAMEPNAAPDR